MTILAVLGIIAYFIIFGEAGRVVRVIGGENAKAGEFPYMVSIHIENNHTCGGSILTKRSILTAAHCLYKPASDYKVYAGSHLLSSGGKFYNVSRHLAHPGFVQQGHTASHDVGFVYLDSDLEFSQLVTPIELESECVTGGVTATYSGWGVTYNTTNPEAVPDNLQKVELKILSADDCADRYSELHPIDNSQMCSFTKYGQGICYYDSGSPLVRNGKLIGMGSWVEPCAIGYPDVYSRLSTFIDWIKEHTV